MINHRCKNCRWWDDSHKRLEGAMEGCGYCRKHKPIVYGHEGRHYGGWPLVDAEDFCGEFREG